MLLFESRFRYCCQLPPWVSSTYYYLNLNLDSNFNIYFEKLYDKSNQFALLATHNCSQSCCQLNSFQRAHLDVCLKSLTWPSPLSHNLCFTAAQLSHLRRHSASKRMRLDKSICAFRQFPEQFCQDPVELLACEALAARLLEDWLSPGQRHLLRPRFPCSHRAAEGSISEDFKLYAVPNSSLLWTLQVILQNLDLFTTIVNCAQIDVANAQSGHSYIKPCISVLGRGLTEFKQISWFQLRHLSLPIRYAI